MPLVSGTNLGFYEILAPLGAGGMGEVYRARDRKLDREVAIKVLPTGLAQDAERLARFTREAKVLASLNHPNIAQIYGIEETQAVRALVMELVPGATLTCPVSVATAIGYARQIAEALEAAHEKGITHRDLKPGNIMVTPEGIVKVLDFGLATSPGRSGADPDPNNSPTTLAATQVGMIMGTAAYMSPEQAAGKAVDKRSDIWSFGVVLYEMLRGERLFAGETVSHTLADVLRAPIDFGKLPKETPRALRELVKRCLERDVKMRLRDIGDARIVLQNPMEDAVKADAATTASRSCLAPGIAAGIVALALGAGTAWMLKPSPALPVTRTVINLAPDEHFANLSSPEIAISPDGANIIYAASRAAGPTQLFLRPLSALKAEPIGGTEGAIAPFFSPDGQWVAFFTGSALKKVAPGGGPVVTVASVSNTNPGGSWASGDTIFFQQQAGAAVYSVPAVGGTPRAIAKAATKYAFSEWPEPTPDGGAILFTAGSTRIGLALSGVITAATRADGKEKELIRGASQPRITASGDLIFAQRGNLMAVPFDSKRLELQGSAIPVVEGVRESGLGAAQYGMSTNGTLAYIPGLLLGSQARLVSVDRQGKEQVLAAPPRGYSYARISPDGKRVLAGITETDTQIWLYDVGRDALARATFDGEVNTVPLWSPDGRRIAFSSDRASPGTRNLFWQASDGSGSAERLTTSPNAQSPASWSPDGNTIAFIESAPGTGYDIWTLGLTDRKPRAFLQTKANETAPAFSPDGRWLAYVSDQSGRWEVYVQPWPGPGGKWQISAEGGTEPVWNPNGRELFYRSENRMIAADVTLKPAFSADKPRVLFESPRLTTGATLPYYDVSKDGHFLMLTAEEEHGVQQIVVVQNWFEELKQKLAAARK
jgi:serine/threonine-protein kinase